MPECTKLQFTKKTVDIQIYTNGKFTNISIKSLDIFLNYNVHLQLFSLFNCNLCNI